MNMQAVTNNINTSPVAYNNIPTACPPIAPESYSACIEAVAEQAENTALKAITALFGGDKKFCQLPELTFNGEKHMGGTGYLDRFQASDLCAPVMRGIDSAKRLFVTFGIQQKVADPETHAPQNAFGKEAAFTIFQRYPHDPSHPSSYMSAGHPSTDMFPLRTASQQYVDRETGKPMGSLTRLKKLLENGYIEYKNVKIYNKKDQHVELHLINNFAAKTENKDEL